MIFCESSSRSICLFEHDLFRKPVPTFRDHALLQVMALLDARGVLLPPFEPGEECLIGNGMRVEPDDRQPEPGAEERERDDSRNAEIAGNGPGCARRHGRSPPSSFSHTKTLSSPSRHRE